MRNLLTYLSFSLLLMACQAPQSHSGKQIFRYNEAAGISSLDPAFARNQANIWATNQIFEGLVEMDDQLRVQPALAKSWQVLDSGTTYLFELREDVLFHDDPCFNDPEQRRLNAEDFVYSFKRLTNPELAAPGSWVFKNVDKISAIGDYTLKIQLKEAFAPFLGILSMKYCSVVPEEAVKHYGNEFRSHPVGTGPFYFKLWAENEKLVLRKNEDYYLEDEKGHQLPYLDAVAITFVPDKQSAFLEFVKGNNDLISGIDASYKDELLTFEGELQDKYQQRFNLYRQPYLNTEYLAFLVDSALITEGANALLDHRVRQAINFGFDRKKMMTYLRNNIGTAATSGMVPRGLPSYQQGADYGYSYDPEKAARLLAEAGFPNGEGLPPISLQTNSSYLDLCEYIQGELARIGISIEVEVTPPSTLRQAVATSKVPFFRASWIADYPDAENYLSLFYSKNFTPGGPNYTHFSNPVFDSLYLHASSLSAEAKRIPLYQKMDSIVMYHAPVVPLYYDQVLRFYPKHIEGLSGNAMNMLSLKRVRKD